MIKKKEKNQNLLIFAGLFLLIFIYLSFFKYSPLSDDGWFEAQAAKHNIFDYLNLRYHNWSARILPEFILYYAFHLPIPLLYFINSIFIVLLSYSLLRLTQQQPVNWLHMCLFPLLLGYSNFVVINAGFLWLTGAVNYLWSAALGSYALIPFAGSYFNRGKINFAHRWTYLIAAILFSLTNEQFILCAVGISLVYIIVMIFHHYKIPLITIINSTFFLAGFIIMALAPGNSNRRQLEVNRWFPSFDSLSIAGHLRIGISWLFINIQKNFFWLLLLLAVMAFLLLRKPSIRFKFVLNYLIFISAHLVSPAIINNFELINHTDVIASPKNFVFCLIPYIFWTYFFVILIINIMTVSNHPVISLLCFMATVLSCILMWFSPTIYASGPRTFVCAAILLIFVALDLFKQLSETYSGKNKWIYSLLLILPSFNYIINLLNTLFLSTK